MKLLLLVLLWNLLSGFEALPLKSCTDDQYKILKNGSAICDDCIRCPPGLGPSVECGSTISMDTRIECQECRAGVNFSSANDFEQCQSCGVCSEDQVLKPCTPNSDTVCEKRCKSKGKYYEKSSDDCQDCTWCCGDSNDIKITECLRKGMPAEKSCTVHRRKLCKPPPSSPRPTTTPLATKRKNSPTERNISSRGKTIKKVESSSNHTTSLKYRPSSLSAPSTVELQVLIGVCVGLGVLSSASLICLLIIYRKRCANKMCHKKLIYTIKREEDEVIACYKASRLFDLFKDNNHLKEQVCKKLDLKKSFAKLARCCKLDEDKVKKLEENPGSEPTQQVFDAIEGKEPTFCFGDFAEILKEIERNDVLHCCVKELLKIHVQLSSELVT